MEKTRWKKTSRVVEREIEGEAVLLDLKSGVYYSLNQVGTFIWSLMEKAPSEDEIGRSVAEEYDVEFDEALRDVGELIRDLSKEGLIEKTPGGCK